MNSSKINQFLKSEKTAFFIPTIGFVMWVLMWGKLFSMSIPSNKPESNTIEAAIKDLGTIILFYVPSISILGLIAGIRHILSNGFSIIAAFGVLLNIIWLLIYLFLLLLVISGVSV